MLINIAGECNNWALIHPAGFSSLLVRMQHIKVLMKFSSHLKMKNSFKDTWSGEKILPAMKGSLEYRIKPDRVFKLRFLCQGGNTLWCKKPYQLMINACVEGRLLRTTLLIYCT